MTQDPDYFFRFECCYLKELNICMNYNANFIGIKVTRNKPFQNNFYLNINMVANHYLALRPNSGLSSINNYNIYHFTPE